MSKSGQPKSLDLSATGAAPANASPEHKRFRTLMTRIEAARLRLERWRTELPVFAQRHAQQVAPAERRLALLQRQWAFELEQLLLGGRFSRSEQDTLSRCVAELAGMLLSSGRSAPEGQEGAADADDAPLRALHDRHAPQTFAEIEAQDRQLLRAHVEAATGVNLGDDDGPDDFEDWLARARTELGRAETAQAKSTQAESTPAEDAPHDATPPRRPGPESARRRKASAAEQRAQQDAAAATQSLREVYRKLASALHPDRIEPGATPEHRAQRTEQMARANAAYAAGDLLALFTLQLQVEQIDLARAGQLAAAQVRHVNRVLAEQLEEIDSDIAEREHAFCTTYGYLPDRRPDPQRLAPFLKEDLAELQIAERELQSQRRALQGDLRRARQVIKRIRADHRLADQFDDELLF